MSSGRSGVLVVDKPSGKTSHDVVAQARRAFGERAVGHAGTLDPMATGVLLLLFGEACKLSDHLSGQDKTYRAVVRFGSATDSLDADGDVTLEQTLADGWLSAAALAQALELELGRSEQIPPAVSAIHDRGVRAHVRARRGETPVLAARPVRLHALSVLGFDARQAELELTVSKGYYVRSFARDLGISLGVPAHLGALRRVRSGAFSVNEACPWPPATEVPPLLSLVDSARRALPATTLSDEGVVFARQGKRLLAEHAQPSELERVSAWFAPDGSLVALGKSAADGGHQVVRGFVPG